MATYLITGTNRGIGAALRAEAEAAEHRVIGSARNGSAELALEFSDPVGIALDLDEPVDVLINNAGIAGAHPQTALEMDWDGFAETLAVNTMAPLAMSQAALPYLRRSDSPRILTISSLMGSMSDTRSRNAAYRASKAAVNKVMQCLATDLASEGIVVALINPGWVRTDMGGPEADESAEDVAKGILKIAQELTMEDTGKFLRFTGEEFPF